VLLHFPLYFFFIIIAFILSFLIFFQAKTPFHLKLFTVFLGITLLVEGIGLHLRSKGQNNYVLYICFSAVEFSFYLYVISRIIHNFLFKRIIWFILIINFIISISGALFIQKSSFNSVAYSINCLFIVFFCIYYFLELFRYPKFVNLKNEPAFWICSGLLFYYCCSLPLFGLITLLSGVPQGIIRNLFIIVNVLNILLYTSFAIAFVCRIKIKKSASLL